MGEDCTRKLFCAHRTGRWTSVKCEADGEKYKNRMCQAPEILVGIGTYLPSIAQSFMLRWKAPGRSAGCRYYDRSRQHHLPSTVTNLMSLSRLAPAVYSQDGEFKAKWLGSPGLSAAPGTFGLVQGLESLSSIVVGIEELRHLLEGLGTRTDASRSHCGVFSISR